MALHDETALDGFTERDPAERSAFNRVVQLAKAHFHSDVTGILVALADKIG